MPFSTISAELTYQAIIHYCANPASNNFDLKQYISQLNGRDMLSVNMRGESLLFSTVMLMKYYPTTKGREVMSLLLKQAWQLDSATFNIMSMLLFQKNVFGENLLQTILQHDFSMISAAEDIGDIYFQHLSMLVNNREFVSLNNDVHNLGIDLQTLCMAFSCPHERNRYDFFRCLHIAFDKNKPLLSIYISLFFDANSTGYRLFDQLIGFFPAKTLHSFFEELKKMKEKMYISHDQHVYILTSHARGYEGFSPLHELILNNDLEKIAIYLNELKIILHPSEFARQLLMNNARQFTAMHQGVNNGTVESGASIAVANFFLGLLQPPYFSFKECHAIIMGGFGCRPLKCMSNKENSHEINRLVRKKLDAIKEQEQDQEQKELNINIFHGVSEAQRTDSNNIMLNHRFFPHLKPNPLGSVGDRRPSIQQRNQS